MPRRAFLLSVIAASVAIAGTTTAVETAAKSVKPAKADAALDAALAASTRTPKNVERDRYRHPKETLSFFGIRPTMTVVELWPGAGWYTEVLAPYLAAKGTYYAAVTPGKAEDGLKAKLTADAAAYGKVKIVHFPATGGPPIVPDGSADMVLTFRNVHNWQMNSDEAAATAFKEIFRMLKPGGVLGVVDHRLPEDANIDREKSSGYVKVSTVRRYAEQAGFRLDGQSEVNANPKDTKDYPQGVWTLPPVLKLGDQDRDKYLAIGESDRMTLKFIKPAK